MAISGGGNAFNLASAGQSVHGLPPKPPDLYADARSSGLGRELDTDQVTMMEVAKFLVPTEASCSLIDFLYFPLFLPFFHG